MRPLRRHQDRHGDRVDSAPSRQDPIRRRHHQLRARPTSRRCDEDRTHQAPLVRDLPRRRKHPAVILLGIGFTANSQSGQKEPSSKGANTLASCRARAEPSPSRIALSLAIPTPVETASNRRSLLASWTSGLPGDRKLLFDSAFPASAGKSGSSIPRYWHRQPAKALRELTWPLFAASTRQSFRLPRR